MFPKVLGSLFALAALCLAPGADARQMSKAQLRSKQWEAAKRFNSGLDKRASASGVKNITFHNPKASRE